MFVKTLAIIQINEYNILYNKEAEMDYFTTIEMSKEWGISSRRIALLCEQNRVEGAVKKGKTWLIPYGTMKPQDARKNKHSEAKE